MTRTTFSVVDDMHGKLRALLFRDANEYGAIVLCGLGEHTDRWSDQIEQRFLAREIVEVPDDAFLERSPVGFTWSTSPFFHALKRAEAEKLVVAVIHSHPNGPLDFSEHDDTSDQELVAIAAARLENGNFILSLVMDEKGELAARSYDIRRRSSSRYVPVDAALVRVLGNRWRFSYAGRGMGRANDVFDRQVRAFGQSSTEDIGELRIGIAGCGGTGSAVASLLPRIGAKRLALFDSDTVDATNLNRMHFATRADASLHRRKVDVVAEAIARLGFETSLFRFPYAIDALECRDALLSCDVVFGCTDDHLGRNFLNRLAHFYLIPVIDMGLSIELRPDGGYSCFDGRVTVVQPGYPCQLCRGLLDPTRMAEESLRRNDATLFRQHRRAGYVADAPDPSPVVATFTTELASMALNELFQRINGYRGADGSCAERVRRFSDVKDADTVPGGRSSPACPLCGQHRYDARGDMDPFLDLVI